jgi:hypothetical protein
MIAVPIFDVQALLAWADYPLPDDRGEWPRLLNQIRSDVVAAAEHIELCEAALAQARGNDAQ